MQPSYFTTNEKGILRDRTRHARNILRSCELCPRMCRINRLEGERGFCQTGRHAMVSSYNAHFGEESPLVGEHGSGTIFFTHCNLLCLFCQNYEISHHGVGHDVNAEMLASMMIELQQMGCHNINLVTPSHVVAQILEALPLAIDRGLHVPLVYNTGGYDRLETLRLLDGVVDIYMPDVKFFDPSISDRLCKAPDYPDIVMTALEEMHRQVGDLIMDDQGIAVRGLLVRHLVMPRDAAQTQEIMTFLAEELSKETYVNVMDQYRPCGEAHHLPDISRRITESEYTRAVEAARAAGLHRLDSRHRVRLLRFL